ncbi:MAG: hypothetical protein FWE98_00430 [Oscillospiraceae bacterium]|nr:hypothetical protein [Oscillospiraceae bacterium]
MEKERLAQELADFCLAYRILNTRCSAKEIEQGIQRQLDDVAFVEELIHAINVKAKYYNGIDADKLIELLSALERIRLEHEYRPAETMEMKC